MTTETADQLAQPPLAPFRVEERNSASNLNWAVVDATGSTVGRYGSKGGAERDADRMNAARGL